MFLAVFFRIIEAKQACLKSCWGGLVVRWCWVNFHCRGVLLVSIIVWKGPTVLAVAAGGHFIDFFLLSIIFPPSPSLRGEGLI